jgi:ABC-type transport system involved in multi-copper enzyme maturation permease subunit
MMRNKAQLLTPIGLMLLVIGASFLAGTIYRSTWTSSGGVGTFGSETGSAYFTGPYSLSPRNYQLSLNLTYYDDILHLKPISSVDFYLLDSKGGELWQSEKVIEPVWFAKNVSSIETLNMEIPHRGDYFLLFINPDNSTISGIVYPKLYGYERDLLAVSVTTLAAGLVITVASKVLFQGKTKQPSKVVVLKKDDNYSSSAVLPQITVSKASYAKDLGRSGSRGQLRRLLIWELEECFAFPMLEVILVIAIFTVLTPAIIEFSSAYSYYNLTSGIQPIFLFIIFVTGVLFCHSYAGGISRGETKMVLSYPVQRSKLFLAKFIALFTVLSVVYIGVFALQVPLLALNPFEPMFYASILLVLLQLLLVCTISTALSVVTKNEVLSILASALLLFGVESVASSGSLVTFTGRFTSGFTFARQYLYGGSSATPLTDGLFSVSAVGAVSVLLLIFSYVYFTRKMEID